MYTCINIQARPGGPQCLAESGVCYTYADVCSTDAGAPGGPAMPGRKRRDAAWFRERALKGHEKSQLQMALCYSMGQGAARMTLTLLALLAHSVYLLYGLLI